MPVRDIYEERVRARIEPLYESLEHHEAHLASTESTSGVHRGIGGAHVSADASVLGVTIVDDSDTVVAGQVGAGIGYAVTPNIVVGVDYRFLMSADPSFDDEAGGSFDSEYMTHNVMAGIRGHF